ncbi:MAG TPA: M23 family metallopeptidase, partial [Allocoleopsis sp.]
VSSFHKGIDFGTGDETPTVEAAAKGTVTYAQTGWNGGFGNLVEIDHGNGLLTRYAHLSKIAVKEGDQVNTSTIIGSVGSTGNSTGNHLHFEIVVNGEQKNPEDYISFA